MKRIPVESSDVVAIGYDAKERVLELEFHEGRLYRYLEVPQDIYEHFLKADSYGGYFNAYINGHYRYRRVNENGEEQKHPGVAIVTGNARKVHYLSLACEKFNIPVEQLDLEIDEIQSDEPEKIALHKAKVAYKVAGRPVVVNDTYWAILALRGFPGAYAHHVTRWFKPEDWLALMQGKADRTIICTGTLVYFDGQRSKVFARDRYGKIIDESRGGTVGSSLEHVVVMDGFDQTMAEVAETGQPTFVLEESIWYDFAKWYDMQRKLRRV
jgi:non-canonical purine NTP pyrophosphatase (RdgB/HAM1 family)